MPRISEKQRKELTNLMPAESACVTLQNLEDCIRIYHDSTPLSPLAFTPAFIKNLGGYLAVKKSKTKNLSTEVDYEIIAALLRHHAEGKASLLPYKIDIMSEYKFSTDNFFTKPSSGSDGCDHPCDEIYYLINYAMPEIVSHEIPLGPIEAITVLPTKKRLFYTSTTFLPLSEKKLRPKVQLNSVFNIIPQNNLANFCTVYIKRIGSLPLYSVLALIHSPGSLYHFSNATCVDAMQYMPKISGLTSNDTIDMIVVTPEEKFDLTLLKKTFSTLCSIRSFRHLSSSTPATLCIDTAQKEISETLMIRGNTHRAPFATDLSLVDILDHQFTQAELEPQKPAKLIDCATLADLLKYYYGNTTTFLNWLDGHLYGHLKIKSAQNFSQTVIDDFFNKTNSSLEELCLNSNIPNLLKTRITTALAFWAQQHNLPMPFIADQCMLYINIPYRHFSNNKMLDEEIGTEIDLAYKKIIGNQSLLLITPGQQSQLLKTFDGATLTQIKNYFFKKLYHYMQMRILTEERRHGEITTHRYLHQDKVCELIIPPGIKNAWYTFNGDSYLLESSVTGLRTCEAIEEQAEVNNVNWAAASCVIAHQRAADGSEYFKSSSIKTTLLPVILNFAGTNDSFFSSPKKAPRPFTFDPDTFASTIFVRGHMPNSYASTTATVKSESKTPEAKEQTRVEQFQLEEEERDFEIVSERTPLFR